MNQIKTGRLIVALRKEKGLTQVQLAEIIGVSDKTVSKWERGAGMPDPSLMIPLCEALEISADELLTGTRTSSLTHGNESVLTTDDPLYKDMKRTMRWQIFISGALIISAMIFLFTAGINIKMPIAVKIVIMLLSVITAITGIYTTVRRRGTGVFEGLVTVILCIGLCFSIINRFGDGKETISGPYDNIDIGTSASEIIEICGAEPDEQIKTADLFYADSVLVFRDFSYLNMSGRMTYWMYNGELTLSVFIPDDFTYSRDIELYYLDIFERDFGYAQLSVDAYGFDAAMPSYAYLIRSSVKSNSAISESITLLLRVHYRDAFFILSGTNVPDIRMLMDNIQEVLYEE